MQKGITHRKHNRNWKDNTHKVRNTDQIAKDNAWANKISGGRYPTLRRLMTAIHRGTVTITCK